MQSVKLGMARFTGKSLTYHPLTYVCKCEIIKPKLLGCLNPLNLNIFHDGHKYCADWNYKAYIYNLLFTNPPWWFHASMPSELSPRSIYNVSTWIFHRFSKDGKIFWRKIIPNICSISEISARTSQTGLQNALEHRHNVSEEDIQSKDSPFRTNT